MRIKNIFSLYLILSSLFLFGQRPNPDVFKSSKGDIVIQPILHGTLVIQHNDKVIYIDPYGEAKAFNNIAKPDLILITDIHGDHLNEKTLEGIDTEGVKIIAPKAVADEISEKYKKQILILDNNAKTEAFGLSIKAVPMYNLPETADAKHVKGRGNGYLIKIGNKTIYISGDTADIPEMRALKNIDIAFMCMNLPYTMNINQAASAVLEFKPKVVYPYHYRGNPDMSDTEAFKKLVNEKDAAIDVRLRNWYPEY
jgi:L-ascorbate metabolism protein UlaG (beta-lactamase superfamily)